MIRFAVRKPYENAGFITNDGPKAIGLLPGQNPVLGRLGISITPNMITVHGRVLPAPDVKYVSTKASVRFGSWNMAEYKFNTTRNLPAAFRWSYGFINEYNGPRPAFGNIDEVHRHMLSFYGALQKVGMKIPPPMKGRELKIRGSEDPALEEAFKTAPQLLLIILPGLDTVLYNKIKFLGDIKYGVHTICVVGSKFVKGDPQYFGNVSLKFNLKLGGVNQLVDNVARGLVDLERTMIVGIDVTHPSPGSASNAPSVAAVVASIDKSLGQFPADLRIQQGREEMVLDLDGMIKSRLNVWKTLGQHQSLPDNILIYRDGVSEGDYDRVLEQELPLIRKACADTYPATASNQGLPKITIVIVGKRHHTRFYPTKGENADRSSNTANGTVVDRGVTQPRNWDFFMQAHAAIQGTARPAHYYVILDEIFPSRKSAPGMVNTADMLEELTHGLCYMFGRATKAVSICPPAYYADIVCERARRYLSRLFDDMTPSGTPAPSTKSGGTSLDPKAEDVAIHPNLRNTMFYI